jgi:mRNA interferase MazF
VRRGELRWCTVRLPDKRRPVMILTRSEVIESVNELIVVPVTRTIRGLSTEVVLTQEDGMPVTCALNFDLVSFAQQDRIGPLIAELPKTRWQEVQSALLAACGFEVEAS